MSGISRARDTRDTRDTRAQCMALALLAGVVAIPNARPQTMTERAKSDALVYMHDDEPAMRKAFQSAQATLDQFLDKSRAPPNGTDKYAVKVGIREGKTVEYFWMAGFSQSGNSFAAIVDNKPDVVTSVTLGQVYYFSKAQIVDRTYFDETKGRAFGNFTACALLTKATQSEVEAMRKDYGLYCNAVPRASNGTKSPRMLRR